MFLSGSEKIESEMGHKADKPNGPMEHREIIQIILEQAAW